MSGNRELLASISFTRAKTALEREVLSVRSGRLALISSMAWATDENLGVGMVRNSTALTPP